MLTYLHVNLKWYLMQKPSYSKTEKYDTKNNCSLLKYYYFLINFNTQFYKVKATI